jgi:hypothetical protein
MQVVSGGLPSIRKHSFCETMASQLRRKIYGNDSSYKLWVTENIGNLGKSREAIMLRRSIRMQIPHIEGRDFYPDLG